MNKKIIFFLALFSSACSAKEGIPLIQTGDFYITEKMLLDDLSKFSEDKVTALKETTKSLNNYIDIYYREKLFERFALQKKIDQTPEFKGQLALAKRQLLINALIDQKKKSIAIPDMAQSAKEYYQVNRDQFKIPEQLEVRHILLSSEPDSVERDKVREKMADILVQVRKDPEMFDLLAKKYSEDTGSGSKGGLLSQFSRGQMVAEFEKVAFELSESGQISEILSSKFGFHIIQLVKKYPAHIIPFKDVEVSIITKLNNEYAEEEFLSWRKEIADPKKATVDKKRLKALVKRLVSESK